EPARQRRRRRALRSPLRHRHLGARRPPSQGDLRNRGSLADSVARGGHAADGARDCGSGVLRGERTAGAGGGEIESRLSASPGRGRWRGGGRGGAGGGGAGAVVRPGGGDRVEGEPGGPSGTGRRRGGGGSGGGGSGGAGAAVRTAAADRVDAELVVPSATGRR